MDHAPRGASNRSIVLGLRENWVQFSLLVAVNVFVGGMIGLERSILPGLAEEEFGVTSATAAVSFIATFGLAKALTNLVAGNLSQRFTRRRVLIAGWLWGFPVPFILISAPAWEWVIGANVLLGLNQGMAWSMTVNMKMDLAGPRHRGLALGFNEAAGYLALAGAAFLTGVIADAYGLRPEPFYLGIAIASLGLGLGVVLVRDTAAFVALESGGSPPETPSFKDSFADVTWRKPYLFGVTQAGLVKNLNDGMAWGVFPLFFAAAGLGLERIAALTAIYPMVWGILQLGTGWLSDHIGRKPLIVAGMVIQGMAISMAGAVEAFGLWVAAACLLGLGTALVYPTLLAAIGDAVSPGERATSLGADAFGFEIAIQVVAALTVGSGILAAKTVRGNGPHPQPLFRRERGGRRPG